MGLWTRLFGKKEAKPEPPQAQVGFQGQSLTVIEGPVSMNERRFARNMARLETLRDLMARLKRNGVSETDPRYQSALLEYEQRELALRVYNAQKGGK